ncbi:TlpA family protein disulfide reductase [Terrimonas sp. NA20]|uniref:TlpA family protein disulfide reductase n=1 Tax=Terrimonas ginsenosidimutans TaxID=2908004 RepID=A0ABS9KN56_9BACT|nr:TlpA disulfide reductase family protein [Terrimonas ginsenosidimutans]MCG2613750.1 TlpA family protein disulfide reductase [Terrimonas ginsenosidimutans]
MKRSVALLAFSSIISVSVQAQIAEQAVSKFQLLKNVSYKSRSSGANIFTGDKSVDSSTALLTKRRDGSWAYKISSKTQEKWYYDHKRVILDLTDKTYSIANDTLEAGSIYLPTLACIMERLAIDLSKGKPVTNLPDSIIAGKKYYHFRVTQLDSMKKDKKIYGATSFVLDKTSLLPYAFRQDGLGYIDGTDMYVTQLDEYTFSDYQVDRKNFPDPAALLVPAGFTAARQKGAKDLLQKGMVAPEMDLLDMKGNRTKLSDYKGKVLLISFTDNGCGYCAMAVGPVNELLAKYDQREFAILNVNAFDSPDAIRTYNDRYHVKFDSYKPGKSAVADYRVDGYPNFYVVDKEGKIVKGFGGFSEHLERDLSAAIETVL